MGWSLRAAFLLPIIVTASVPASVQHNRSGGRGPTVLTERELLLQSRSEDDTAATLSVSWHQPYRGDEHWLTREKLRSLGFRCEVDPGSASAAD